MKLSDKKRRRQRRILGVSVNGRKITVCYDNVVENKTKKYKADYKNCDVY